MSLKEAVRFRKLCTQLTKEETNSFLLEIVSRQSKMLIACMCSHFMSELTDDSLTININNTISSIIDSRESKPKHKQYFCIRKLDEIPKPLISNVASYLEQKEYANLCKTNRDIFIGCNSPQSLQSVYITHNTTKNYFPFNSNLYSSVKHLHFELSQYKRRLPTVSRSFLENLQSIVFSGSSISDDRVWLEELMEIFPLCKNIGKLHIENWGFQMEVDASFQEFVSKFPNVTYLKLHGVENVDVDSEIIMSSFPQLKGLDVAAGRDRNRWIYTELIHHFGDSWNI